MGPSRGTVDGEAPPIDDAARKRVAVETFVRHEVTLRQAARRVSICDDDAEEALQRGLEILLHKAPTEDARELVRWTQTVVRHEALAVRAERERTLAGPAAKPPEPGHEDWVAMLPTEVAGPAERAERDEAIERSREALATLKPQEVRTLGLLAGGYSYREISEITGYSERKVNRAISEGRERFRRFLVRREGGARCAELAPLLSAFADDEAGAADVATLRDHLRTCAHCRSTLRAYRAAPGAAAALLPVLPRARGVADRLHDAYAAVATRVGGGSGASDSTLGGLAAAGGTRGAGMPALAKLLALCAGTVGGAAACVATGVVPPLIDPPEHHSAPPAKVARHHHRHAQAEDLEGPTYVTPPSEEVASEPEAGTEPRSQSQEPASSRDEKKEAKREEAPAATGEASLPTPPPSEAGGTEYTEPAPVEVTGTTSSVPSSTVPSGSSGGGGSTSGSAAGEFGP